MDALLLGAVDAGLRNQTTTTDAIYSRIPHSPCQCVEGVSVPMQLRNFSTWDPCFKDGMVLKAVAASRIECVFFAVDAMTLERARAKGWRVVGVPISADVTSTAVEVLTSPLKYYLRSSSTSALPN